MEKFRYVIPTIAGRIPFPVTPRQLYGMIFIPWPIYPRFCNPKVDLYIILITVRSIAPTAMTIP
jgi:hypothetical protein